MSPVDDPHDDLLALARQLAADAAALLLDGLTRARREVSTKSTATDMVTEIDRESENLIVRGILDRRPDDGIVGEEGADVAGTSGVRWIVDPVDGTTNYLYGLPGFSVSIAAQVDGDVVVGVVHDPMHDDVYSARRGVGAWLNDEPLHTPDHDDLATALVATGFAYDPARRARQAEVLVRVLPRVRDIRRMGAASVDLCATARGRVNAYYERGLGPWDLAAGALVAEEAGAIVGSVHDQLWKGGLVLAAPPSLYDAFRDLVVGAGAADA